ncbi:MAG: serine/threonine protein kinase [Polyangiaceae bacterium]|nr:serine/threonine protein kinase [Polyangiaceae bacterium]
MSATPEQIGKYRVLAKLGQGGMATVWLTVSSGKAGFEKLLVVKELRSELADDPEFLTMFLDEARLAARLNHPNVVHTYEVGQDDRHHYIAMDYLEGQSLQQLLRKVGRKGLPLELHVRVLADMLTGLDYAHTLTDFDGTPLHVVHRDVSPHNVFVTYDGQVKVVDFGIAKAAGASTRTRTGVYKGKPAYIAPEQARALPVDARADVFAVGIMLWEAIAGRRMAEQADEMAILAARITAADPKIRDFVPDAPAELADACDKAMAHAREDRFESAQAMHEVLVGWLEQQPKRSGAKDLGAFVSQAFSEERAALRTKIDQQLKLIRESSHSRPIPVIELGSGPASLPTPTGRSAVDADEVETMLGSNTSATARSRDASGSGRLVWLGVGAVAVVGAAIGLASMVKKDDPETRGSAAPSASVSTAEEVELVLHLSPEGAEARLDGVKLEGRPARLRRARDGSSHELEVTAPGHRAHKRALVLDRAVDLKIELEPLSAAATSTSTPTSEPTSEASAKPTSRKTAPGGEPRGPATASPSAGTGIRIDEQNPYGP